MRCANSHVCEPQKKSSFSRSSANFLLVQNRTNHDSANIWYSLQRVCWVLLDESQLLQRHPRGVRLGVLLAVHGHRGHESVSIHHSLEDVSPIHGRSALERRTHVRRRPVQPGTELVQGGRGVQRGQVGEEALVQALNFAILADVQTPNSQFLVLCREKRTSVLPGPALRGSVRCYKPSVFSPQPQAAQFLLRHPKNIRPNFGWLSKNCLSLSSRRLANTLV